MTAGIAQASFAEIRDLLTALPGPVAAGPDADAGEAPDLLDGLRLWLSGWQGRTAPQLDRPRAAVFVGRNDAYAGAAEGGVSAAQAAIAAFRDGRAAAARLCRHSDAELRVHELAVEDGDGDPALTESACATAMAYGMMAVEEGLDLLCLTATGPGMEQAAAALCRALDGGAETDPLEALRRHGGHAIAAVAGSIMAARMGRVPVLLDGLASTAAAAVLHRLDRRALDHCLAAHVAAGDAHRRLLDRIGKEPLLDLGLSLEDGSGPLLALGVLRGVVACREGYSPA